MHSIAKSARSSPRPRSRPWQAINTVMVDAYWEVGRAIVEDEQAGKPRASYGKRVLEGLAKRLQTEFGKGYDPSNLRNMRAFFVTYPIRDALRRELSWTHYRLLLRADNPAARAFLRGRGGQRPVGHPRTRAPESTHCSSSGWP